MELDRPLQNIGTAAEPSWQPVNPPLIDFLMYWGPVWQGQVGRFPLSRQGVIPPAGISPEAWEPEVDLSNFPHEPGKVRIRRLSMFGETEGFQRADPLRNPPPALFGDPALHDHLIALGSLQAQLRIWIEQATYGARKPQRRPPLRRLSSEAQIRETAWTREVINEQLRWLEPALEITDHGLEIVWQSASLVPFLFLQVAKRLPWELVTHASRYCAHCQTNEVLGGRRRYCSDQCSAAARSARYYAVPANRAAVSARRRAKMRAGS